jgi:hypothetical protein
LLAGGGEWCSSRWWLRGLLPGLLPGGWDCGGVPATTLFGGVDSDTICGVLSGLIRARRLRVDVADARASVWAAATLATVEVTATRAAAAAPPCRQLQNRPHRRSAADGVVGPALVGQELGVIQIVAIEDQLVALVATRLRAERRSGASLSRERQAPLNSSIMAMSRRISGVIRRASASSMRQNYTHLHPFNVFAEGSSPRPEGGGGGSSCLSIRSREAWEDGFWCRRSRPEAIRGGVPDRIIPGGDALGDWDELLSQPTGGGTCRVGWCRCPTRLMAAMGTSRTEALTALGLQPAWAESQAGGRQISRSAELQQRLSQGFQLL